jgi:hypothetical protein
MVWLDKLEKRLRKSPKSAADAEEISDELDVSITSYMTISSHVCFQSPSHFFRQQDMSYHSEFESRLLFIIISGFTCGNKNQISLYTCVLNVRVSVFFRC